MPRIRSDRTNIEYRKVLKSGLSEAGGVFSLTAAVSTWAKSTRVRLRAALWWSVEHGERTRETAQALVDLIPFEVRSPKRNKRTLAPQELDILLNAVKPVAGLTDIFTLIVRFVLSLGLRAEETMGMGRKQVQDAIRRGELVLKRKGNKEQGLFFGDRLEDIKALDALPNWKHIGDLICKGHLESQKAVFRRKLKAWGKTHGIDLHPHALRHAFAILMDRNGADLLEIQTWLGHESIQTTRLYLEGRTDPKKLFKL